MSEEYYDPTDLMDVALDRTKRIYSGFYEQLDKTGEKERLNFFKDAKTSSDTVWSELVKYYKKNGMSLNDKLTISMMASRLCAFYHWKEHRKLYIFDEDSVNEIMLSYVGNKEIDSDFFTKLPFNGMCMYVPSKQNHMNNCIIIYAGAVCILLSFYAHITGEWFVIAFYLINESIIILTYKAFTFKVDFALCPKNSSNSLA